jgi:hypothetical protein
MANSASSCQLDSGLITAENGDARDSGTGVANYSPTVSCDLAQPNKAAKGTWGGARNRADRVSYHLSDAQVEKLMEAARYAFESERIFQRHWTVHYGLAGIESADGARFVGKLIDLVKKQARREGGDAYVIWVRERASGKGEHVHILMHLPAGMSLRNRTRRWIVAAGGTYRARVSKVTRIGGLSSKAEESSKDRACANAANVVRYFLKAGKAETCERLGLNRSGEGGVIFGKRCGWSQNLTAHEADDAPNPDSPLTPISDVRPIEHMASNRVTQPEFQIRLEKLIRFPNFFRFS